MLYRMQTRGAIVNSYRRANGLSIPSLIDFSLGFALLSAVQVSDCRLS